MHIIHYLHDCYQADNRGTTVWNLLSDKVEHRLVIEGKEELINGFLPHIPVNASWALAARKAAYLYRKEKRLVHCSFVVMGRLTNKDGQTESICSPLFFHSATIDDDDSISMLSVNPDERQVNYHLLEALCVENDLAALLYERILSEIPGGSIDFAAAGTLVEIFREYVPQVDPELLFQYPQLIPEDELRQAIESRRKQTWLQLVPAAVIGLIKRSQEARGVLTELRTMAESDTISAPVRLFFDNGVINKRRFEGNTVVESGSVPAVLSDPQHRILASAARYPLSLVIGPPGTGKSYTIAAIAVDHLSRGESVLIASKMNHAVDVVGNKIEEQLGIKGCVVRGGRKQYLRDLKRFLEDLLHGMIPNAELEQQKASALKRRLRAVEATIRHLEHAFVRRNRWEVRWGQFLAESQRNPGRLGHIISKFLTWKIASRDAHASLIEDLERALQIRDETIVHLIRLLNRRRIQKTLQKSRNDLNIFLKAIRARTGGKQEELFQSVNFRVLLNAFPIWLVNLADIYDVLPLQPELFDLAIIDEATQCDMASCLPILQRAKRAIIVGDPKQLRHISFLSRQRQRLLGEKHGLNEEQQERYNYREKSILDVVDETISSQDQVFFLDEHYRSVPQIIAFSNREFYGDALRVMTEKPNAFEQPRVIWKNCQGTRTDNGRNDAEARQLVADVVALIEEEAGLDAAVCQSIGILSPFRDQVDYVFHLLTKTLPLSSLDKHRLLAGTAYTFQGEERDAMFLSFAIDPNSHANTSVYLNRPDIFNVSVTRGRAVQYIYTSIQPEQVKHDSLLHRYLDFIAGLQQNGQKSSEHPADPFMQDVKKTLDALGVKTWNAYSVAGLRIDIVIEHNGYTYGLDLIGYPGEFAHAFTLERYKMFHRAGLKISPLPYTAWILNRDECLHEIRRLLQMA